MCGNQFNGMPTAVDMCVCNNPCSGNLAETCGGFPGYLSFYNLSKSLKKFKLVNISKAN